MLDQNGPRIAFDWSAASIRRKARTNQMSLADYLQEELLGELVLGKPE
jgi:hypothetical protein